MAEYTIKPREAKTLRVNVGEESFQIPLQGSLSIKEAKDLDTAEGTYKFLKAYIPENILEELRVEDYNQLLSVWRKESEKHSGKKMGE